MFYFKDFKPGAGSQVAGLRSGGSGQSGGHITVHCDFHIHSQYLLKILVIYISFFLILHWLWQLWFCMWVSGMLHSCVIMRAILKRQQQSQARSHCELWQYARVSGNTRFFLRYLLTTYIVSQSHDYRRWDVDTLSACSTGRHFNIMWNKTEITIL